MFAFQTLGVMADAAEAIATDADVRKPTHVHFYVCTYMYMYILCAYTCTCTYYRIAYI